MMRNKTDVPVIGLTGNSGSGKTTVASLLAGYGGYILDADALGHEVMLRGHAAYDAVLSLFGQEILADDGEIDRRRLGETVFNDRAQLTALENIIHPAISNVIYTIIETVSKTNEYAFFVIDAPLLIEAGIHTHCDSVWVVTAARGLKEARAMERDGLSREAVRSRLQNQRDEDTLVLYADIVIQNDGNLAVLAKKVRDALTECFV